MDYVGMIHEYLHTYYNTHIYMIIITYGFYPLWERARCARNFSMQFSVRVQICNGNACIWLRGYVFCIIANLDAQDQLQLESVAQNCQIHYSAVYISTRIFE
jgi:hypothetical protein